MANLNKGLIKLFLMRSYNKFRLYCVNERIKRTARRVGKNFKNNSFLSCVNKNTVLGDYVSFNGLRIIGDGEVFIGSHFHCGEGCYIITQNHDYDNGRELPYDRERSVLKKIVIEDNVWLGVGVIILGDAHIGEGAIIQAGSVVLGNIPGGG